MDSMPTPQFSAFPVKKKEHEPITRIQKIFIIVAWVLGYLVIELCFRGIGMTLLMFSLYAAFFVYCKAQKLKLTRAGLLLTIPVFLLILSYSFFSDLSFYFVRTLFLPFICVAHLYILLDIGKFHWTDSRFLCDLIMGTFTIPFQNFRAIFYSIYSTLPKGIKKNKITAVLLGLVIALPILFIMFPLLIQADLTFSNMMSDINEYLFRNFPEVLGKIICAAALAIPIYSIYYTLSQRRSPLGKRTDHIASAAIFPPTTVNTVLVLLDVLYLFFVGIQVYNLFLFTTDTATSYKYASYAREGFFQLVVVAFLNLVIVLGSMGLIRHEGKPIIMTKLLNGMLIVLTSVMLASSLARLCMYINGFGMTRLRIFSLWAIAVIAVGLILIFIYICKPQFKIFRTLLITGLLSFVILNYMNCDYLVASYNVNAYLSGKTKVIDLQNIDLLSDDAFPATLKLYYATENSTLSNSKSVHDSAKEMLINKYTFSNEPYRSGDWRDLTSTQLIINTQIKKLNIPLDNMTK